MSINVEFLWKKMADIYMYSYTYNVSKGFHLLCLIKLSDMFVILTSKSVIKKKIQIDTEQTSKSVFYSLRSARES